MDSLISGLIVTKAIVLTTFLFSFCSQHRLLLLASLHLLIIVGHFHLHLQTPTHKHNYNFPLPSRPLNNGCCCWSRRRQRWIQSSLWRQQTTLLSVFAACLSACLPVFGSFECLHTRWQTTAITITTAYYPPPAPSALSVWMAAMNPTTADTHCVSYCLVCTVSQWQWEHRSETLACGKPKRLKTKA